MTYTEYFETLDVKNAEMDRLEMAWKDAVRASKTATDTLKADIEVTQAKLNYLIALSDYSEYTNAIEQLIA